MGHAARSGRGFISSPTYSTALGIAELAGWRIVLQVESVLMAVAFAFAIGVFFGFYPARKAAHLNPVEALRFE